VVLTDDPMLCHRGSASDRSIERALRENQAIIAFAGAIGALLCGCEMPRTLDSDRVRETAESLRFDEIVNA
jgi:hypothetical protein